WQAMTAQAIVARAYLQQEGTRHPEAGAAVCDQSHCQRYLAPASPEGRRAVQETADQVVADAGGRPVPVYYHADCGGHTAPVAIVFGGQPWPHLAGVADPACAQRPSWQSRLSLAQNRAAL